MNIDDITRALEHPTEQTADGLPIVSLTHDLDTPHGRLRLREDIGRAAWMRSPRRAVLLLPGPVALGSFFRIPVPGFDSATELGRAGYVCLTVDLLGTGDSEHPEDGRTCTVARNADALRDAIRQLGERRGYASVDVIGESWGGAIGTQLAADPALVRSCVVASCLFRDPTPAVDQSARGPETRAALSAVPDGYLPVGAEVWGPLTAPTPPAVAEWSMAHQPGRYASAAMVAVQSLPYFDPALGRAPALVVRGGDDPLVSEADALDLAATYGGPARAVTLANAGHIPRVEAGARASFWTTVLGFLDSLDDPQG